MHAAAISWMCVALLGQAGGEYGYGEPSSSELGPRMSVSAGARTRSTRATTSSGSTNPLYGAHAPARVATSPRYASDASTQDALPPIGNSTRVVQDDQQSALADKLLRDLIQPTRGDQSMQPLQLIQALERTSGSQQQFTAIKAYWEWSLSVSELRGVLEEDSLLANLAAPRDQHDKAAHAANRRASESRLKDSQLDVADKVVDLFDATGMRSSSIRPADVPFVGLYNTNFSRIFPDNSAPATLKKIHQTLPYALKVVRSRADSFEAARAAMYASRDAYQGGQCSYNELTDAIALVRSQRRAFLDSVCDYNFAIAEYALSVAGPGMERQTVVSMLIKTTDARPYRGAALDYSGDVRTVSGTQEVSDGPYSSYLVSPEQEGASSIPAAAYGDLPLRRQTPGVYLR